MEITETRTLLLSNVTIHLQISAKTHFTIRPIPLSPANLATCTLLNSPIHNLMNTSHGTALTIMVFLRKGALVRPAQGTALLR